jgi:isopentenyldiphosphate isomerase
MTDDEILDVVDKDDQVIGQRSRAELYAEGMSNFRVINAFLKNEQEQIWIPRRTAHKRLFPLCLDVSVGGHVSNGERYIEALRREVKEELNLDLDNVPWRFVGRLTPHENGVSAFMKVYEMRLNQTPRYNVNDFVEYFWLSPEAVLDKIQSGEPAKDDLPRLIQHFYI